MRGRVKQTELFVKNGAGKIEFRTSRVCGIVPHTEDNLRHYVNGQHVFVMSIDEVDRVAV